jgi:predicted acetyltransferase
VVPVPLDGKSVLQQMLELYEYDFSEFEGTELDSHGSFGYPYLDLYWLEAGRHPFIVRVNDNLAGFVLVNQKTYLPSSQWAMSEFFIMRKYRRQDVGRVVALSIFNQVHGNWEVDELQANTPSQDFWRKIIAEYTGGTYMGR